MSMIIKYLSPEHRRMMPLPAHVLLTNVSFLRLLLAYKLIHPHFEPSFRWCNQQMYFVYFIYIPFILIWLGNSLSMYQLFSVADGHTIRDWGSPPLPRPRLSTLGTEVKASNSPPPRPPRPSRRSQCCKRLDAINVFNDQLYVTNIYSKALVFCCMFAL